ncbi:hypothetical protein DFJ73DRAFT_771425 [Zopfochytrium polystomum]|nr:hypothetical protein DFJ73DRAFT_771425 [Zopfochytrium polystomum]
MTGLDFDAGKWSVLFTPYGKQPVPLFRAKSDRSYVTFNDWELGLDCAALTTKTEVDVGFDEIDKDQASHESEYEEQEKRALERPVPTENVYHAFCAEWLHRRLKSRNLSVRQLCIVAEMLWKLFEGSPGPATDRQIKENAGQFYNCTVGSMYSVVDPVIDLGQAVAESTPSANTLNVRDPVVRSERLDWSNPTHRAIFDRGTYAGLAVTVTRLREDISKTTADRWDQAGCPPPSLGILDPIVSARVLDFVDGRTMVELESVSIAFFHETWKRWKGLCLCGGIALKPEFSRVDLVWKAAYCCLESQNYRRILAGIDWWVGEVAAMTGALLSAGHGVQDMEGTDGKDSIVSHFLRRYDRHTWGWNNRILCDLCKSHSLPMVESILAGQGAASDE